MTSELPRRRGFVPALNPPAARAVLATTIVLGLTGDALFFDGVGSASFCMWIVLFALNAAVLADRAERPLTRATLLWLGAGVVFASAIVWRNSDQLVALDGAAAFACLTMAGITLREPNAALFAPRFRETMRAGFHGFADALGGFLPMVFAEIGDRSQTSRARSGLRRVVRPLIFAALLAFVFGSLLRDADPIFASFLNLPALNAAVFGQHIIVTVMCAWAAGGWLRSALAHGRDQYDTPVIDFELRSLDIVAALGTLNVLFALYVVAQLGWIFGGEAFLHSRTGLTAAQYARRGFFEMAWVVALVVPVLVVTRGAVRVDADATRRHTWLSLPLIAMLGVMIVSAVLRVKMYVHFYGLTTDRLYPLVFMGWLAFVLAWLAMTVLRNRGRTFVAGAAMSGMFVLGALNVIDPDAIVARENVARHVTGVAVQPLDLVYLSRLSGGATEVAVKAIIDAPFIKASPDSVAPRCLAASNMLSRFGPTSESRKESERSAAWRFWNHDDAVARRVVDRNATALYAASPPSCFKTKTESR